MYIYSNCMCVCVCVCVCVCISVVPSSDDTQYGMYLTPSSDRTICMHLRTYTLGPNGACVRVRVRVCVDRTLRKKESSMRSKTLCKAPSMVTTSACWRMGRCLCVCVCIRAYTYIYIHIHTYSIYIYIYIYIGACVRVLGNTFVQRCQILYVCVCIHLRA